MSYALEVGQGVHREIAEHWAFLETRREGLGDRLVAEIYDVFAVLQENPRLFQNRYGQRRIALTKRFKYKVIYRIKDDTIVRILTVRHPKQHPTVWMKR